MPSELDIVRHDGELDRFGERLTKLQIEVASHLVQCAAAHERTTAKMNQLFWAVFAVAILSIGLKSKYAEIIMRLAGLL